MNGVECLMVEDSRFCDSMTKTKLGQELDAKIDFFLITNTMVQIV
jgi:hypothetical protein